jgi:hypothetical protein
MASLDFQINDVGNLVITLTKSGMVEIERLLAAGWNDEDIFLELLDEALNDGWFVIAPDQIRAQTGSLLLSDSVEYDDAGNVTQVGRTYWFPNYKVQRYTQTLLKSGQIIFQQGASGIHNV